MRRKPILVAPIRFAENPPVLWARRVTSSNRRMNPIARLAAWCPMCQAEHFHGGVSNDFGAGDGHRVAHCLNGSGFEPRNGYILREVDETEDAIKRHNSEVCQ